MRRTAMLMCVLALGACREVPPFELPPFQDSSAVGRLTYNVYGDHVPVWNKAGDSLYYQAHSFPSFPATDGILLSLPRKLGTAKALLPSLQIGTVNTPWLAAPALSPDGNTVAFFEITQYGDRDFPQISCPFPPTGPGYDTTATASMLREAVLRVRSVTAAGGDNAQLTVQFPGRVYDYTQHPGGALYVITNVATPFHRLFEGENVPGFRASWSPDGTKLVFSDGASLRLWTVGQPASTVIPNTDGGMLPAWSPDGSWIAYSKPVLGPTQSFTCYGFIPGSTGFSSVFNRTVYRNIDRETIELNVIKPDGTGKKSLGMGDAPAWMPDSKTIVAHRSGSLFSVSVDTGAGTAILNTNDAYEPAVSRDGHYLAFTRRWASDPDAFVLRKGQYNLWYASF